MNAVNLLKGKWLENPDGLAMPSVTEFTSGLSIRVHFPRISYFLLLFVPNCNKFFLILWIFFSNSRQEKKNKSV